MKTYLTKQIIAYGIFFDLFLYEEIIKRRINKLSSKEFKLLKKSSANEIRAGLNCYVRGRKPFFEYEKIIYKIVKE